MTFLVGNVAPGEHPHSRGPAGVEGWTHVTPNERRLIALCEDHGLTWAYTDQGSMVDPNEVDGAHKPGTIATTYLCVGQVWQGDGDSAAEKYWDIAYTIQQEEAPGFDWNAIPDELPSSVSLGPGLWHLDCLCRHLGIFWVLLGDMMHCADNWRKGQVLIGGIFASSRPRSADREEILEDILGMLEAQLGG